MAVSDGSICNIEICISIMMQMDRYGWMWNTRWTVVSRDDATVNGRCNAIVHPDIKGKTLDDISVKRRR